MNKNSSHHYNFIDLFAGCGGLSLGLMQAGWQGLFAVEKSKDAFETLSHNLCSETSKYKFDWPEWLPCKKMTTGTLLGKYASQLKGLRGEVDLIAGGPPCQGFSFNGLRNPNDPRNKLTEEYIKLVALVRPRFLLLENVKGFQSAFKGKNKPYSLLVKEKLEKLPGGGYIIYSKMVEASLFGVPQPRPRFIMIAVRKDLGDFIKDPFQLIEEAIPSFRNKKGLNGHHITVKEAIGDLKIKGNILQESSETKGFKEIIYVQPKELSSFQELMRAGLKPSDTPNSLRLANHKTEIKARFERILKECPKGKTISKEMKEEFKMKKQCFTPLHPDLLSRTVTTLPDDMLHFSEPRILTVREQARLQTFPDWFQFKGKYTTGGDRRKKECPRYTQVGNAVPPLMAEAIGSVIFRLAEE